MTITESSTGHWGVVWLYDVLCMVNKCVVYVTNTNSSTNRQHSQPPSQPPPTILRHAFAEKTAKRGQNMVVQHTISIKKFD